VNCPYPPEIKFVKLKLPVSAIPLLQGGVDNKPLYDFKFTRILVTLAAIIFGTVHLFLPQLPIDAVMIALLGIAFFPWLNPLIKSIELPGIGRLELNELRRQVEEASGAAESANQKADFAVAQAMEPDQIDSRRAGRASASINQEFSELAAKFDQVGEPTTTNPVRAAEMIDFISKMISIAPYVRDFDVEKNLNESAPGKRLLAYAYLLARPDPKILMPLVNTLTQLENKDFNQYWAILAVEKIISISDMDKLDPAIYRKLQQYLQELPYGTDRFYELSGIVESISKAKTVQANPNGSG